MGKAFADLIEPMRIARLGLVNKHESRTLRLEQAQVDHALLPLAGDGSTPGASQGSMAGTSR
ncbi:hypothetical protein EBL85_06185 [Marichromatium sp. AB32]|nr:hypothetical protein EBL85_06185 [Marichromatium sp. AB32]